MAIPARQRWVFYAIALVLTFTAVKWAGGQDRAGARTTVGYQAERPERPAREAPVAAQEALPELQLERLGRRGGAAPAGDPFEARSWEPKITAVQRHLAPPPPQAPPLPFTYLGKLVDGEQTTLFLAAQDRNYIARVGDTLDGSYRVETIAEDGVALTYLPLGAKQTLSFGAEAVPVPASARPRNPRSDDEDDNQ